MIRMRKGHGPHSICGTLKTAAATCMMIFCFCRQQEVVVVVVHALSISTVDTSSAAATSPWASATWKLQLNFGRQPGSKMPESWGASGSRLVVPITVQITSETLKNIYKGEEDAYIGPGASQLIPLEKGSYVTMKGTKSLELGPVGGWTMQFPRGKSNQGLATTIRFWLDLAASSDDDDDDDHGLCRNDVILSAGERLYFTARAWREEEFKVGLRKMRPIQRELDDAQRILTERLSHESGDRRLDGTDALETLRAYGDMTQLVMTRDLKRLAHQEALQKYPSDINLPQGPWPGAVEWMSLSKNNPIYVARNKNILGQEYHVVGTWDASPVLKEGE